MRALGPRGAAPLSRVDYYYLLMYVIFAGSLALHHNAVVAAGHVTCTTSPICIPYHATRVITQSLAAMRAVLMLAALALSASALEWMCSCRDCGSIASCTNFNNMCSPSLFTSALGFSKPTNSCTVGSSSDVCLHCCKYVHE